jgi:hypothetical protein
MSQHQWVSKLFDFDFSVEYKLSATNIIINALSRCDMEASTSLMALPAPSFRLFYDLHQEFDSSSELRDLRDCNTLCYGNPN